MSGTNAGKTDRRVLRTRIAIHTALRELLSTMPLEKITVTALAQKADINRKTFYLHYSSVDDAMDDFLDDEAEKLVAMLAEKPSSNGSAATENILKLFSLAAERDSILQGGAVDSESMDTILNRVEKPLVKAIIEHDTLGIADKAGDNLGYVVAFYCAGLIAVFRRWLRTDSEMSVEELSALTARMMNMVSEPLENV